MQQLTLMNDLIFVSEYGVKKFMAAVVQRVREEERVAGGNEVSGDVLVGVLVFEVLASTCSLRLLGLRSGRRQISSFKAFLKIWKELQLPIITVHRYGSYCTFHADAMHSAENGSKQAGSSPMLAAEYS